MILYTDKNEKLVFDLKNNLLDCSKYGSLSRIYKINDYTLLKVFHDYFMIDTDIFKKIIDMGLPGFYKVYEIVYDEIGKPRGYLMKYYKNLDLDLLSNKDYLIDNYMKLYESINILSNERIFCADFARRNVLTTENGIIVIDIDFYKKIFNNTIFNIKRDNIYLLNYTFGEMLDYNAMIKYNKFSNFRDNLFDSRTDEPIKKIMNTKDIFSLIKR